jgi:hypothetical protein
MLLEDWYKLVKAQHYYTWINLLQAFCLPICQTGQSKLALLGLACGTGREHVGRQTYGSNISLQYARAVISLEGLLLSWSTEFRPTC